MFRLAEFCCGTGAFSLACKSENVKLVFANDIDKNSSAVFNANFEIEMTLCDIHKLDLEKIPKMDILTAGFPLNYSY